MNTRDYEILRPDASSLMESLRAFGYSTADAIADLADNSITAGAKRIDVVFEWNAGNPWIAVIDNGSGMTEDALRQAMKPGSANPTFERDKEDLGRFGLGMKTASLSQCRKMTVASKTAGDKVHVRAWDLDVLGEEGNWVLLKEGSPICDHLISTYLNKMENGTIILWECLDRIIPQEQINNEDYQNAFLKYAVEVKQHISIVFSSIGTGKNRVDFFMNNRPIELWDPFMADNNFTQRKPLESFYVKGGSEVKVRAYILPHVSNLTTAEYQTGDGTRGWTDHQGFYIYRNNRMIVMGDWLLPEMKKRDQYKLARIRIDIDNSADQEWGIDVRKSIAVPPISIRKELRRIAKAARKESSKIYRHRGKKVTRSLKKDPTFVWKQINQNGKIAYRINREHPIIRSLAEGVNAEEIKELIELIEETIPVPAIISDFSESENSIASPYETATTEENQKKIKSMFNFYRESGFSKERAFKEMACIEPFLFMPGDMELFRENEGIELDG